MRSKIFIFTAIALFSISMLGCGGNTPTANNAAANNTAANGNTNSPVETKTPAPVETTNNAPTLTPVFKAFCDAKIKKDETALRKVYSADTIKNFESQMKDEKVTSLVKFLEDEKVTAKLCEISNEVITGDKAVALIMYDSYPKGLKVQFVKENGEWKMTTQAPDFDAIKPSGAPSNTAK